MKPVRCKVPMVECHASRHARRGVVFWETRLLEADRRCTVMPPDRVSVTRIKGQDDSETRAS